MSAPLEIVALAGWALALLNGFLFAVTNRLLRRAWGREDEYQAILTRVIGEKGTK